MTGLYIHIPFCVSRCRYCDFYTKTLREANEVDAFLCAIDRELEGLLAGFRPETVFVGGGTPTVLSVSAYGTLLESMHRHVDLSQVVEFTSEANPGTLSAELLNVLVQGGVNRISIGVQSFHDRALQLLGRIHSAEEAIAAYHQLRDVGINNVNIDLIQGIPGMSFDDMLADTRQLIELGPEHVSYYNLIYEAGTALTKDRDAGLLVPAGEELEADAYYAVKDLLASAGYPQYEISNFSKPSRRCLHNVLYWQGGDYFGVGPAAYSHWQGERYGNIADLDGYVERVKVGVSAVEEREKLPAEQKARELLVMQLRMLDGVDLKDFEDQTGYCVDFLAGDSIQLFVKEGLLALDAGRLHLTREALFVSNAVLSEFV